MPKLSPDIQRAQGIELRSRRTLDFVAEQIRKIEGDINDRSSWLETKLHFFRRRYGLEWRNPIYPWEGSSDIVMPLIDMQIDRLKPLFTNLVFRAKPPVTFLSDTKQGMQNAANNEMFFDWLIRVGSPNFKREIVLGVDDMLECGVGVWKTGWQYETHRSPETLTRSRLPLALRNMVVSKRANKADSALIELAQAQTGANIMTPRRFDELKTQISELLQIHYQLDPDDPLDSQAMSDIMSWLRAGAEGSLRVKRRDVFVDAPRLVAVHPNDFVVPEHTNDLEDAERLVHIMFMTERQLEQSVRDKGWDKKAVKELVDSRKQRATGSKTRGKGIFTDRMRQEEAFREGVSTTQSRDALYEIWEISTWFTRREGAPHEKSVFLTTPEMHEVIFKAHHYNRPSGKWNFHATFFEVNNRRYYSSRGVGEKMDDLDAEITFQHRAKLNRATIANSPTFLVRQGANINSANWRWLPGQFYPVQNPQLDVAPLIVPNLDISFDAEQDTLRRWAEQLLGSADLALSSNQATQEARTAEEIRAIQAVARNALSLRGEMFQATMTDIYNEFFDMWHEWGPDEIWVQVTGEDPLRFTKEQLQGDFHLIPSAKIGEQDEALEAQRKLARVQVLLQVAQSGAMGDEFELDLPTAILDWLESEDLRAARKIVRRRDPDEIQAIRAQRAEIQRRREMLEANAPQTPEELEETLKFIEKESPNEGRQRITL